MLPLDLFPSRQFTAANLVTFAGLRARSAACFFLLVAAPAGGGRATRPLAAGTALLPVTVLMLLLSARVGRARRSGSARGCR